MQLIWSQNSDDCGPNHLVLWVATTTSFLGPTDFEELASIVRQLVNSLVTEQVEQEKQTIDVRVEQDSDTKALEKLKDSLAWSEAEEKRLRLLRERDETYRALLQNWLNWTFSNLHRASNGTTFYYLVWTPLVIFWSVIITWSVPTAIACPKPDGICHNTRMLALSFREQFTAIPKFLSQFVGL